MSTNLPLGFFFLSDAIITQDNCRKVKKVRRPATAMHLVGWYQKETSVSDDTGVGVEGTGEDAATGRGARGLDCRHEHGPTLGLFCLQSAAQDTNQVRLLFDSSIEAYHPIVPCIQFLRPSAPPPPPAQSVGCRSLGGFSLYENGPGSWPRPLAGISPRKRSYAPGTLLLPLS